VRYSKTYRPRVVVALCQRSPVAVFVTVTTASASALESESVTVPTSAAVVTPWAGSAMVYTVEIARTSSCSLMRERMSPIRSGG
jgi:hypothetical protein